MNATCSRLLVFRHESITDCNIKTLSTDTPNILCLLGKRRAGTADRRKCHEIADCTTPEVEGHT